MSRGCCCVREWVQTDALADDGTLEAEPHLAQWAEIGRDSGALVPSEATLAVDGCLCKKDVKSTHEL